MINFISILLFVSFTSVQPEEKEETICLSEAEMELYQLLNQYRKEENLPSIQLSNALTKVAQIHVRDLMENYEMNEKCNMHSWSKEGDWTSCCYTSDHKEASCMWNKPREIAGYESDGFEIAHWTSSEATPNGAIEGWKKSSGHNQVMINLGIWKGVTWQAVGVGIYQQYAVIWFGQIQDPKTIPEVCN